MSRSILGARPVRLLAHALRRQPHRTFATPPIKDTSPPSPIDPSKTQAHPIGPFYESILLSQPPIPDLKPEVPPTTASSDAKEEAASSAAGRGRVAKAKSVVPSSQVHADSQPILPSIPPRDDASNDDVQTQARVIFGSSLAGPAERAERAAVIRDGTRIIVGVCVPPRPDEPDNCCMSGCVNCVWDRYRDEMDEWAAAKAEVDRRLQTAGAGTGIEQTEQSMTRAPRRTEKMGDCEGDALGPANMDTDGGLWPSSWESGIDPSSRDDKVTKTLWNEELYKNVPVGIREFMKTEKRLKAKHSNGGTVGG